jgi:hypothetical protein
VIAQARRIETILYSHSLHARTVSDTIEPINLFDVERAIEGGAQYVQVERTSTGEIARVIVRWRHEFDATNQCTAVYTILREYQES